MDISVKGGGGHAAVYISDTGAGYCKFEELSGLLVQNAAAMSELLINYDWLIAVWGRGLANQTPGDSSPVGSVLHGTSLNKRLVESKSPNVLLAAHGGPTRHVTVYPLI